MITDKRIWIGLFAAVVVSLSLSELSSVKANSDYTTIMVMNVLSVFGAAAVGGFIARHNKFMVPWLLFFALSTGSVYWTVYRVARGASPMTDIIETNAGWTGLALLCGIAGVYCGVYFSRMIGRGNVREM